MAAGSLPTQCWACTHFLQHGLAIGIHLARLLAHHLVVEDRRERPGQVPGLEERGQAMLQKIIDGRWVTANAVLGLYPANSVNDDDIALYTDESRIMCFSVC